MVWPLVTGGDYTPGPYSVTFFSGMTYTAFDVPITNDAMFENNEHFMLTINSSSLPNGFRVGDSGQATVTIVDDDGKLW